jgi:hypothetical protein
VQHCVQLLLAFGDDGSDGDATLVRTFDRRVSRVVGVVESGIWGFKVWDLVIMNNMALYISE